MNTNEPVDARQQQLVEESEALEQEQVELSQQSKEAQLEEKTPLELAMLGVMQVAAERQERFEYSKASAIANFFDNIIKEQQEAALENNLLEIRNKSRLRNLLKPIVSFEYPDTSDHLINADKNDYTEEEKQLDADEDLHIADENRKHYIRARDTGHIEYTEKREKNIRFYEGNQWSDTDLQELNEVGRPALVINKVLTTVNAILSLQLKEQASFFAQPINFDDIEKSEVVTKLLMHISRTQRYSSKEASVFKDTILSGRGFLEARIDFSKNIEGDIKLSTLDPNQVLLDPDSDGNDPREWTQIITTKWVSLNDISMMFGEDKAKLVEERSYDGYHLEDDFILYANELKDSFGDIHDLYSGGDSYLDKAENRQIKTIRIISRQYKKYKNIPYFFDPRTGESKPAPFQWKEENIKEFAASNNLYLCYRKKEAIRWTTTAGDVVLQDCWSPYRTFTVIPLFCYYANSRYQFGMVENLISPQEQLNKIESQETHVINTTANSGWIFEEDSLVNMNSKELARYGAKTGIALEVKRNAKNQPMKIQPNNIPQGLANASNKASENIAKVSGVDSSFIGIGNASSVSDAVLQRKINQTKDTYAILNQSLNDFREIAGAKILELIQDYYTDKRVYCISNPNSDSEGYEKLIINEPHPMEDSIINDMTLGEFVIDIKTHPVATTMDNLIFSQIMQMREVGIEIPAYRAILSSDMPNKKEVAEEMQSIEGLTPPTEQEQQLKQAEQELELQRMQLEVAKLNAEVQKLNAEAMLAQAQAQVEVTKPEAENIRSNVEFENNESTNRLRKMLSDNSTGADIQKAKLKSETDIIKEQIKAQSVKNTQRQQVNENKLSDFSKQQHELTKGKEDSNNRILESVMSEFAKSKFNNKGKTDGKK